MHSRTISDRKDSKQSVQQRGRHVILVEGAIMI